MVGEIRKALFVVFRLCLPVRMVFPVRAVPCMPAVYPLAQWLAGIRTVRFAVFLPLLPDRTVFPVRQLLLGMAWLLVQLPGRLVNRAFVVLLLWEQLFLLVIMVFLVRAVWLLVQCLAPLLVLCVAYRPQVLRRRQELTGKALLQVSALLVPLLDEIVRCVVWQQSEQQFLLVRMVCLPERLLDVA